MRLSEFLQHPELKRREVRVIGYLKTAESEFAVRARKDEKVFPLPKLYHLVEVTAADRDPEVTAPEQRSILSRFGYFDAISRSPGK